MNIYYRKWVVNLEFIKLHVSILVLQVLLFPSYHKELSLDFIEQKVLWTIQIVHSVGHINGAQLIC